MTNATVTKNGTTASANEDEEVGRVSISCVGPIEFRVELERLAAENHQSFGDFVRSTLADAIGYKLPKMATKSRGAFMSEAEKKAAAKAKADEHRARMKELLNRSRAARGLPVPTAKE